jgi:hypothetical protein
MVLTERALRDLLQSRYSDSCGESILDAIEGGQVYTIHMEDGTTMTLADRATAGLMLHEFFRWKLAKQGDA